ncbi:unnamed protein product [Diatraea saccharalis]|uniref:Uncharacterized protein n=1 Tax=Diatraea saccharalis TaxID=40085 RepID=A0A9N9RGT6_9NEOP|nr:unnamed protein product [Diatraea saccharalis]
MSNRSRKIIDLVTKKYDHCKSGQENILEISDVVQNATERDSPLPPGANFTQEQLSILDDIDIMEDTDTLFQDLPSNSSIFPSDAAEFSPVSNNENCTEVRIMQATYLTSPSCEKRHDDTPIPSPYADFYPIHLCDDTLSIESPISTSTPTINDNDTDSSMTTPTCRSHKRISATKKDKGRQRERFSKEWKDEIRKRNVNRGLQYISRNGKVHNKKQPKPSCPTTCRKKCNEKISESKRAKIFSMFWDIGDHSRQWDFLTKYATKNGKKRLTTDHENTKRLSTISYTLPIYEADNVTINKIPVCKTMFLNTLSISFNFLYTALRKHEKGHGVVESDKRGKHGQHIKKLTEDMKKSVLDHVGSFPLVESHYTRKESTKMYLDGSLSFPKMYSLYEEWFDSTKYTDKVTSVRQYRDIINKNLNISFHKPKKDTCEECHIFENNKEKTEKDIEKQTKHLTLKDLARKLKTEDKDSAQQNPEILTAAYDLQKCLNDLDRVIAFPGTNRQLKEEQMKLLAVFINLSKTQSKKAKKITDSGLITAVVKTGTGSFF